MDSDRGARNDGTMRMLLPAPTDSVDVLALPRAVERPRPAKRPWVTMLMIGSADGAATVDGRSGGLGGPGDQSVYRAVRSVGDAILVGAATVRAELYRPLDPPRRLLIPTSTGDLGASAALLDSPHTTLLVPLDADVPAGVTTVRAGRGHVDLAGALAQLDDVAHVVCEGGPSINGQLLAAGLIDEVCLSLAPRFVAGRSGRIAHGDLIAALDVWRLDQVLEDDGFLFLRYLR